MQKFQELLTQAAHLKEFQLKQERKGFQSLPEFLKSSIGYSRKYSTLRKQHFWVQMHICSKLKKQGNQLFLSKQFKEAIGKYQQALSIFRYISSKTNENMKDSDLSYYNYEPQLKERKCIQSHQNLMKALYWNISSCLTKLNLKVDSVFAADEGLKIGKAEAKGHYRKAQAYVQYINRDQSDIKLGFLELKLAYDLSRDPKILQEMHRIKKEIEHERKQEGKCFKFMFDKNSQKKTEKSLQTGAITTLPIQNKSVCEKSGKQEQRQSISQEKEKDSISMKGEVQPQKDVELISRYERMLEEYQTGNSSVSQQESFPKPNPKFKKNLNDDLTQFIIDAKQANKRSELLEKHHGSQRKVDEEIGMEKEFQKFQKTKEKLKKYTILPVQDWQISYQEDFIQRHGSKIYSIIKIYGYVDLANEFRSILAQCLQTKEKSKAITRGNPEISIQIGQEERKEKYTAFIEWIRGHPIEQIKKYRERYSLQSAWIAKRRKEISEGKEEPKEQQIQLENKTQNKKMSTIRRYLITLGIMLVIFLLGKLWRAYK